MAGWSYDFFPTPGRAIFDPARQHVTAVSRAPGNLDLFIVGLDNRVWSTFWNDRSGWAPEWFPLPGAAVFDHTKQQVAAVSRAPGNLDLFIVGFDNRVWSTFWNAQGGWSRDWFPLPGGAVFDHNLQQVAAVSRAPNNLDLFIVGFDNRVWSTFWNTGGWSRDWFPLPGGAVFDHTKQQVAAVSRAQNNLDLFIVGFDNRVWSTFWNTGGWSRDWFPLPGGAVFDHNLQQVAAVSRAPNNLDLFIVGFDNRVWSTFWNTGGWSRDWFPIPGGAVFDHTTQQVAAVSRADNNLDLFIVGFDNRIWSAFWNPAGWSRDWFPLPGRAVFDHVKQRVAAVSRAAENLDLFIVGFDSRVWTTYWGPNNTTVTRLIDNGRDGAKVTIAVVGDGFSINDQYAFNDAVDRLFTNGMFGNDYFSANKRAFNLIRINVMSTASGVSTKTYLPDGSVKEQVNRDTFFGAIYSGDWAHCWLEDGPQTARRLSDLMGAIAPERRVTVLLLNNPGQGGCGGGGRATMPLGISWPTVAHEFGHALGGLADEYHGRNDRYTGGEPGEPNATINTNRATLKWRGFVAASTPLPTGGDDWTAGPKPAGWNDNQGVGLFEGGRSNFATGVYRPVINCRMRTNSPAFCPVCNGAMLAQTNPFLRVSTEAEARVDSYVRMEVRVQGGEMTILNAHEIEGPFVEPAVVANGLAHEVMVNGSLVAIGSAPDAMVSRSFSEPGYGPPEHHIYDLDTYEFAVRVPTSSLRGARASDVTITVVDVPAPTPAEEFTQNAGARTAPVASLNLGDTALPDALREVLTT
ncbi:M64 family metallopeptidase [Actinoplanes sp. NPDC049596]|uniref:M64 family metallopeptidase n=1 Tax=unclassified Actinoplanes TaxID=2626549 RepID=UPI00343D96F3